MTGIARDRKLRYVTVDLLPLRSLLLASFFVLGVFCAHLASGRFSGSVGEELSRYLKGYLSLAAGRELTVETVVQTLLCFLRSSVIAFLLGFASIGVVCLPLLFAAQGFLLAFSLFSFSLALGREGFLLLPALFLIRLLFVVPCTFLIGAAAFDQSRALAALSMGGGKRIRPAVYGSAYWYRFAVCCVCLIVGAVLELWLVPVLLSSAS